MTTTYGYPSLWAYLAARRPLPAFDRRKQRQTATARRHSRAFGIAAPKRLPRNLDRSTICSVTRPTGRRRTTPADQDGWISQGPSPSVHHHSSNRRLRPWQIGFGITASGRGTLPRSRLLLREKRTQPAWDDAIRARRRRAPLRSRAAPCPETHSAGSTWTSLRHRCLDLSDAALKRLKPRRQP